MYQDVKFIEGRLYYEEKDGKWYPVKLPMAAVGGRARAAQVTSTTTSYAYLYDSVAGDYNIAGPIALAFENIINNSNITLEPIVKKNIIIGVSGIYNIDYRVCCLGLGEPAANESIALYVNGNPSVEPSTYTSLNNGTIKDLSGIAILNLQAGDILTLVAVNAMTIGNGAEGNRVALTISKVN